MATRARTRAETNSLMATSYKASRALNVSLGAAATVGDAVTGAIRPLGDPARTASRVRDDLRRTVHRLEQRSERERKRIG
jgi:hypothetical protein